MYIESFHMFCRVRKVRSVLAHLRRCYVLSHLHSRCAHLQQAVWPHHKGMGHHAWLHHSIVWEFQLHKGWGVLSQVLFLIREITEPSSNSSQEVNKLGQSQGVTAVACRSYLRGTVFDRFLSSIGGSMISSDCNYVLTKFKCYVWKILFCHII